MKENATVITKSNLKDALIAVGFSEESDRLQKHYPQFDCDMAVDFKRKKLIYPDTIKGRDRNDSFDQPENFVVFECVDRLLTKGYRPEDIELEKEWHLGHDAKSGRADICVSSKGSMLFIIECKTYGREFDKAKKDTESDGAQLFSYWQQENYTKWLVLYSSDYQDGRVVYKAPTINCTDDPNIVKLAKKDSSILLYSNAHTAEEKHAAWRETYQGQVHEDLVFSNDTVAYKIGIKPLYKKDLRDFTPEDKIVNRFEEILRHNNVSDKENAFNRLVALFICKLVDEITKDKDDEVEFQYKQGTDDYESLQDRLQRLHTEGMEKFMREKIFYVKDDYPEWLFATYTGRQRRKAIEDLKQTIRILKYYSNNDFSFKDVHNEELFYQNGKILVEVVQLFEKYRIVYPSKHQFLGDLFEQLLNKGFKQNEGQFFTPTPITRFIWDSLPLQDFVHSEKGTRYPKIVDYACGAGHFLTEAVEAVNAVINAQGDNSWVRDHIFGIEKDYRLARVSKISLFMNGAGEGNIIFGDGLENDPEKGIENGNFDILVANPPYSVAAFKQHLQLKNNDFRLLDSIGKNGSEIEVLFVERIAQLLKPKGIAAVILPSSILSNDSASYMGAREELLQNFFFRAIVQFGSKTFGATGTNTVVLFLEKFDEPPKRREMVEDSVNSILTGEELTEWEDREIYEEYITHIGVPKEEYNAFINEAINYETLADNEYFEMYVDSFKGLASTKKYLKSKAYAKLEPDRKLEEVSDRFYQYAKSLEFEKLYYFALTRNQKTVIITAPTENAKQKEFLGYDWSNRKGSEGIQINSPGGRLYNERDRFDDATLAGSIRKSFKCGDSTISDENSDIGYVVNTSDMIVFTRLSFNKAIKTSVKARTALKSKYPLLRLDDKKNISVSIGKRVLSSEISDQGGIPVYSANVKEPFGYIDKFLISDFSTPSVLWGIDGDWMVSYVKEDTPFYPTDHCGVLRVTGEKVIPYYVSLVLDIIGKQHGFSRSYRASIDRIEEVEIPVPPLEIQESIVEQCEKIDEEYKNTRMTVIEYRQRIEKLFSDLEILTSEGGWKLLKRICDINISKSTINSIPDETLVSFVEMASVSNDGYIENKEDRLLGDVRKGGYTYFAEGDIIIAKITPCMENGKCAVARDLTNGIGFGSSEFHVFRCHEDIVRTDYLFGYLNRQVIRTSAERAMTGASGHRRVPISFYEELRIPILPLDEQDKIVAEARRLQNEIIKAEEKISGLEEKKKAIIDSYLS